MINYLLNKVTLTHYWVRKNLKCQKVAIYLLYYMASSVLQKVPYTVNKNVYCTVLLSFETKSVRILVQYINKFSGKYDFGT